MFTRELVLKEIEKSREEKIVGSSLEANIIIEVDKEDLGFFQINSDLLKKCLIVSQLQINQSSNNEIKVLVSKTKYKKCQRCWMYFSNNEFSAKDSNLCLKCETQLSK
jgi:isoleucyl-tRNA synthetase